MGVVRNNQKELVEIENPTIIGMKTMGFLVDRT